MEGYLAQMMAEANAEIKEQEVEEDRIQKGTHEYLYISENEEEAGELSNSMHLDEHAVSVIQNTTRATFDQHYKTPGTPYMYKAYNIWLLILWHQYL